MASEFKLKAILSTLSKIAADTSQEKMLYIYVLFLWSEMYFLSLFFVQLFSREYYDSLQITKPYIYSSLKDFE